jgi:hypothetical protein
MYTLSAFCQNPVFMRLVAVLAALFLAVLLTTWQPNGNQTATKENPSFSAGAKCLSL